MFASFAKHLWQDRMAGRWKTHRGEQGILMIDLHLHTTCSDGRDTPEAVVQSALLFDLRAISITDHDTMAGHVRAQHTAKAEGYDLDIIPGIELSAVEGRSAVHILGYGVDPAHASFTAVLQDICMERHTRAQAIVERLQAMDVPLTMAAVEYTADGAPITRAHIAEALVMNHHVGTYAEAFERYLSNDAPAFIPHGKLSPEEAIACIHDAGGIAVMAHPVLTRRDELVAGMVRHGLDGIEIIHPSHTPASVRFYHNLAAKHGLIVTGGSDYHGRGRGSNLMGTLTAPMWMLGWLLRRIGERRGEGAPKSFAESAPSVS